jgi:hypothetical protein
MKNVEIKRVACGTTIAYIERVINKIKFKPAKKISIASGS